MYEDYLSQFEFLESPDHCRIRLTQAPYENMEVVLAKRFRITKTDDGQSDIEFDYEIVPAPEGFGPDPAFLKLLGHILAAILELKCSVQDITVPEDETGYLSLQMK